MSLKTLIPLIAGARLEPELNDLTREELRRYSRHIILPEVGLEGQKRLKSARVAVIGAGGLGSPVALYLAAAGVGTLGLIDFDVVDVTNLQRQVIHSTADVGRSKLESARDRLSGLNPHIRITLHEGRLTSANAKEILTGYDVIVDGSDNFPTRYLVNDACALLGKPYVYGSIYRFDGQATVFDARQGPCYRCLYPSPPPPGLVPDCSESGVLGVLPGIIGSLQALETVKLIIGQGETLVGRLLIFDALKMSFREFKLKKDPACPLCGDHRTLRDLIDYENFCGAATDTASTGSDVPHEITVEELKTRLESGELPFILDVREPHEYQICNLGGRLIPLGDLARRIQELDPSRETIVYCKTGRRSSRAVDILRAAGFKNVKNLAGGIERWAERIDSRMPRY